MDRRNVVLDLDDPDAADHRPGGPALRGRPRLDPDGRGAVASLRDRLHAWSGARCGARAIFFGIATPTEAAGVGAFGATLLAAANKRLDLATIRQVGIETTLTTAFIFGIFIGATAFALVMRSLGGDEFIGHLLKGMPFGPNGIAIFILFVAFIAGFFLDWLEITLIMLSLVAPVIKDLGFDLVWFVVIFAVCLQTSFLTPPVGFSLFYLKGVVPKEITTAHIYRGIIPFVVLQLLALAMSFVFPQIVLWLPRFMYGSVG